MEARAEVMAQTGAQAASAESVTQSLPEPAPSYFECEDCIGMIEYGCYCAAMGCIAPCELPTIERTF